MPPNRLAGWQAIAAYLNTTVRSAQRWERERGLPVHRIREPGEPNRRHGGAFAFPGELDAIRSL